MYSEGMRSMAALMCSKRSLSLSGSLINKAFIVVNTIQSKRSECSLGNQIYITSQEIF